MSLTVLAITIVLAVYHHIGYPHLLRVIAGSKRRALSPPQGSLRREESEATPSMTLLVPAHNEQKVIREKLLNVVQLRYPVGRLAILFALDGCRDDTELVLRQALAEHPDPRVQVVIFEKNLGKLAILNRLVGEARTDLVALSDTSALLEPEALQQAADHFLSPAVGVVCGTYLLTESASEGERTYWQYQVTLKTDEAKVGAAMGAHGAFYAFRRSLWSPLESDTINDDFILPMRIVAAGWRSVYDPQIVAKELEGTGLKQDFRRRVRIGAGNMQQAIRLWRLADPRRPGVAFVFLSGKALRAFMPFVLLTGFIATSALASSGGFGWNALLYLEIVLGALAALPLIIPQAVPRQVRSWSYLVQGYIAAGLGVLLLMTGQAAKAWSVSKTGRGPPTTTPLSNGA